MTVGELLSRVSSAELTEWLAYYAMEAAEERALRDAQQKPDDGKRWRAP